MDPYEVLGLQYPSSKEEIKNRYRELAMKHHPDKLFHLSEKERHEHEEQFKKINVAYELLSKSDFEYSSKSEWKGIWSSVESFMSNSNALGDLFVNVIRVAKEYKSKKPSEHHITVHVTLEEIHQRKDKKLRLFLNKIADPIFIKVNCGCYPSYLYTHITKEEKTLFIYITFQLSYHSVYSLDTLFNSNELYTKIPITLYEYFTGVTKQLTYLDNTKFDITIPPCCKENIHIPNKGLFNKDELVISVDIQWPSLETYLKTDIKKREKFLKYLQIILE